MLEDEPKFEVMKLFQHFDKDGSGVITFKNLKEVLNALTFFGKQFAFGLD